MTSSTRLDEQLSEHAGFHFLGGRLIEAGRTAFQSYEVWDTPQLGKLFRLDGYFMTSERDEFFYHENLVQPAAVTHPDPHSALVIGGGDGGSVEELFKHPSIRRVVLVELDARVVELARTHFHAVHHGALDDPRLELRIADGLDYVRRIAPAKQARFDLVVLDLTDPIGAAAELYSATFLADCKALLTAQGALVLHIGSPFYQPERVRQLHHGLRQHYAHVTPYFVCIPLYGTLWGMACASDRLEPAALPRDEIARRILARRLCDLQYYNADTHHALMALPNYLRRLLHS